MFGLFLYMLVYFSLFLCIFIYFCQFWFILVYFCLFWYILVTDGPQMVPRGPRWSPALVCSVGMQRWCAALVCSVGMPASQIRVGDGGDGRISPEHPSPILHAPRDIISCKGESLTPIWPCLDTCLKSLISAAEFYTQWGAGLPTISDMDQICGKNANWEKLRSAIMHN